MGLLEARMENRIKTMNIGIAARPNTIFQLPKCSAIRLANRVARTVPLLPAPAIPMANP
ncbi:hypothetical protein D1872_234330 [compost metagenome]